MSVRQEKGIFAAEPHDWSMATIAEALGFRTVADLSRALGSIENRGYRQFVLADGRKRRVITSPLPWLKRLQRHAYDVVLKPMPISSCVYSRVGEGVVKNAQQHLGQSYLMVLDVTDCFPSTTMSMVLEALCDRGIPRDVAGVLTRLTTYKGFLPQGPPTSPAILNLVFGRIDEELSSLAERHSAVYTRYMDDIALSGSRQLTGVGREAVSVLRRHHYSSNPAKRREWGPSDAHTVTKIVVSTTLNPTAEFLAALSNHIAQCGRGNCGLTDEQLRGKIAWVTALNPVLGRSLEHRWRTACYKAAHSSHAAP